MENKKTKLTISGNPKKSFKNLETSKTKGKKTVVIDKQSTKPMHKGNFNRLHGSKPSSHFKKNFGMKPNFTPKVPATSDFERRKLAEQRATKRLKGESEIKDKKAKIGSKKRAQAYSFESVK